VGAVGVKAEEGDFFVNKILSEEAGHERFAHAALFTAD
jgi:hypothetical protein